MALWRDLRHAVETRVARHRNRGFMEASMAGAAWLAMADGAVGFSERMRLDGVVESLEDLKVFDVHEAVDRFNDYVEAIRADPARGKADCLAAVAAMAGDADHADLVARVCMALGAADGTVTETERARFEDVCAALGVRAERYRA